MCILGLAGCVCVMAKDLLGAVSDTGEELVIDICVTNVFTFFYT